MDIKNIYISFYSLFLRCIIYQMDPELDEALSNSQLSD